jgi:hypothetical protein
MIKNINTLKVFLTGLLTFIFLSGLFYFIMTKISLEQKQNKKDNNKTKITLSLEEEKLLMKEIGKPFNNNIPDKKSQGYQTLAEADLIVESILSNKRNRKRSYSFSRLFYSKPNLKNVIGKALTRELEKYIKEKHFKVSKICEILYVLHAIHFSDATSIAQIIANDLELHPSVRMHAVGYLTFEEFNGKSSFMRKMLNDNSTGVVFEALGACVISKDRKCIPIIKSILPTLKDPFGKKVMQEQLEKLEKIK